MARQSLSAQSVTRAGLVVADAAVIAADGAAFPHDSTGKTLVRLTNGGGSTAIATFRIATQVDGIAVVNNGKQVTVAAGATKFVGPFGNDYKQSDGKVYIDCDGPLSIAVLQIAAS